MEQHIDQYLARPRQYFNIDGVGELGLGFMALGFGVLQWLQISSPMDSIWNRMYTLFVFAGVIAAITHYGPKALKERVTYPRTGYVEYRKDPKKGVVAGVTSILVAMVITVVALRNRGEFSAAPALVGLAAAASYAYGFARAVRWKWFVALALTLGAVTISTLPSKFVESWADPSHLTGPFPAALIGRYVLISAFFGITVLVSGGITFCLYLHHTRPQAQDAE